MSDSLAARLSKFPLLSTAAMFPLISFVLPYVPNTVMSVGAAALPGLNCIVLLEAVANLQKERSALSQAFSLATCCLAVAGPSAMLLHHSDNLGSLMGFAASVAAAGAFNIVADYTQNVRVDTKTKVLRNDDQTPPAP